jgi:putative transposase
MAKEYHHGSHSKFLLKYHFVFCVKYRKKLFYHNAVAEKIKTLFTETAEKAGFTIDMMETDKAHIHVLIDAPPTLSCTDIATRLKSQSTYHIWRSKLQPFLFSHFWKEKTFWSDGYFVCTTGDASTETIRQYIEEQG